MMWVAKKLRGLIFFSRYRILYKYFILKLEKKITKMNDNKDLYIFHIIISLVTTVVLNYFFRLSIFKTRRSK
jgi:hypothetical protein